MILGAGILQLPAIEKAVKMGLRTVALDMNPEAVGFSVPGVEKEVISTIDIPAAVEAARRHHIDGVMTLATDMPMRTVAAIAEARGLPGVSAETALKATDKSVMREALRAASVPIPVFYRAENRGAFFSAAGRMSGPFMVKPADSSGSRGITRVADKACAEEAYEYARKYSRNGVVLVEECMVGPEVSVETLAIPREVLVFLNWVGNAGVEVEDAGLLQPPLQLLVQGASATFSPGIALDIDGHLARPVVSSAVLEDASVSKAPDLPVFLCDDIRVPLQRVGYAGREFFE